MLPLYWSQDGDDDASRLELLEQVPGLHNSCRQLKDDMPCWRPPNPGASPSLHCRWYGWYRPTEPPRGVDPDLELMVPSALCLLLTPAVLRLTLVLSCRVKQTALPSLVCGGIIITGTHIFKDGNRNRQ